MTCSGDSYGFQRILVILVTLWFLGLFILAVLAAFFLHIWVNHKETILEDIKKLQSALGNSGDEKITGEESKKEEQGEEKTPEKTTDSASDNIHQQPGKETKQEQSSRARRRARRKRLRESTRAVDSRNHEDEDSFPTDRELISAKKIPFIKPRKLEKWSPSLEEMKAFVPWTKDNDPEGFDPQEMFEINEKNFGVKSSFDPNMSQYTCPLKYKRVRLPDPSRRQVTSSFSKKTSRK
ncbi:ataxin-2-like protein [Nematostella vectensis]|uniref:ataxin-2-like protein n=1 Tax=Nematostella vectensis TaxID=45351 RepID=UPI00207788E7|nr:ataxin-2-like protein [Nematostella vectensis]XP_048590207.1 ataxin-2-like protein [Nematostella vectensis]